MPKQFHEEFDRRISTALESVDVPTDLSGKIMAALQQEANASFAQGSLGQGSLVDPADKSFVEVANSSGAETADDRQSTRRSSSGLSKRFNRRSWLAAAVAASAGGMLFGYRQLTQPLSQPWLIESSLGLLEQIESSGVVWKTIESDDAEVAFLREVGFFRQVRNVGLGGSFALRPPRNMEQATAFNLGTDARGGTLVLLDLVVERGVQGLTHSFKDLPQNRSDAHSLAAMQSGDRLLVMAGRGTLSKYILRGQTT